MARQRDYQPSIDRLRAKCELIERRLSDMTQRHGAARREADWCRGEIRRLEGLLNDLDAQARLQDIVLRNMREERDAAERALDTAVAMLQAETLTRQAAERRAAAVSPPTLRERFAAAFMRGST